MMKFAEAVSSEVAKRLGAGFHVHVLKPVINNGIVQTQLCIEKEGQQFRPSIHLKDFFECYKKGKGLQAIIDEILECYASAPDIPAGMQEIVNDMSFEKIKDKIMCKLVPTTTLLCWRTSQTFHIWIYPLYFYYYVKKQKK